MTFVYICSFQSKPVDEMQNIGTYLEHWSRVLLTMVLCSWVDPEDEEDTSREVEAGKSTEEKVAVGMKEFASADQDPRCR